MSGATRWPLELSHGPVTLRPWPWAPLPKWVTGLPVPPKLVSRLPSVL